MTGSNTSEKVVELLRETADKIEEGNATLSKASYSPGYPSDPKRLDIEWWDDD